MQSNLSDFCSVLFNLTKSKNYDNIPYISKGGFIMTKYQISSLFLSEINGTKKIIFQNNDDEFLDLNYQKISNFKIIGCLKDVLEKNGIDLLMIDSNGNPKQFLDVEEINNLLNNLNIRNLLSQQTIQKIDYQVKDAVNLICNLLGLNLNNNSHQSLKNFEINEIVIDAKKLNKFKFKMMKHLKSLLLCSDTILLTFEVGERDVRILNSLNNAKIPIDLTLKNIFSIEISRNGYTKINGDSINKSKILQKTY